MKKEEKTREQLLQEIEELRRQITDLGHLRARLETCETLLNENREGPGQRGGVQRDQQTLLEHAEKLAGIGVAEWDAANDLWRLSDEWLRIHGATEIGPTLEDLMSVVHPEDRERTRSALEMAVTEGTPCSLECRIIRPQDGQMRFVRISGKILEDESNRPAKVYAACQDITERKLAEQQLLDARERSRVLSEATFEAIFLSDKGVCIGQNLAAEKMFGYSMGEALGRSGTEWITPEHRGKVLNNMLSGYEQPYEACALRKDGTTFPCEIQGKMLIHGGRRIRVTALRDITARKRAEEELRKSEERYRRIVETANEGIWAIDANHRTTFVNRVMAELLGYRVEEMLGQPVDSFMVEPELNDHQAKMESRHLGIDEHYERKFKRKDGNVLWAIVSAKSLHDQQGRFLGSFAMVTDITERKRSAEALEKSESLLRRAELTAGLGHWKFDLTERTVFASAGARRIYGLGSNEWSLPEIQRIPLPEYRKMLDDALEKLMNEGKPYDLEFKIRRPTDNRIIDIHSSAEYDRERNVVFGVIQDITRRKQAEETVRKSEEKLRFIIDNIRDIVFTADTDGNYTYVSPSHGMILGRGDEVISRSIFEYIHPEDIDAVQATFVEGLKTGKEQKIEFRYLHPERGYTWLESIGRKHLDDQGKTIALITSRDISERRQAEKSLRESEEKYRELVQNANSIILRMDTQGNVTFFNEFAQNFFGYPEAEIIGRNVIGTIVPETDSSGVDLRQKMLDICKNPDRYVTSENEYMRRDGKRGWIAWTGSVIYDEQGEISEILCVGSDLTERKMAEEELKKRESLLQKIFDILPVGLWFVDKDGVLLRGNPMGVRIWGAEPLVGPEQYGIFRARRLPSGEEIAPEDWSLHRTIKQGITVTDEMLEIEALDGKKKTILNYTAPVPDDEGRIQGAIVVNHDITEQKRAEEERKRLEAELRHAQKMEAVGTLAGGIAHEFNNILGIVLGNAELASDDVPEWNPARFNLDEIKSASLRARDVVRQLLTFSRKTEENRRAVDLIPVVKEAVKLLRSSIPTNIEFRQNIADRVHAVSADPTQIHQVMINLSTNASHAMEDEGGTLEFSLQNVTLNPDSLESDAHSKPGDYVLLEVRDTGGGIPAEIMDRIFDPYFTTKGVGKGTGMGLAVVHGIVENHEGLMRVESQPGGGTTFKIFFPAIKTEIPADRQTTNELPTGTETILFVDDEESIAFLGRLQLNKLGYQVHIETDPLKALEVFARQPEKFDLVITDMTMPGMTGDHLLKEMLKIRADVRGILCTGFSERVDEERAHEVGARAYALKPLDRRNLALIVRKVLDAAD